MATVLFKSITQLVPHPPLGSNADILIQFQVAGVRSDTDVVEIYASGISDSGPGTLLESVDINLIDLDYEKIVQLPAGSFFKIYLCPRTKNEDGTLSDYYEGQYWGSACPYQEFPTNAAPTPIPNPPPSPQPPDLEPISHLKAEALSYNKIALSWDPPGAYVNAFYREEFDPLHFWLLGRWQLLFPPHEIKGERFVDNNTEEPTWNEVKRVWENLPHLYPGRLYRYEAAAWGKDGYTTYSDYVTTPIFSLREFLKFKGFDLGRSFNVRSITPPVISIRGYAGL